MIRRLFAALLALALIPAVALAQAGKPPLSSMGYTTSAQLRSIITDETGTGSLVFGTSPTLVTPNLGTPSAIDLANATGYEIPSGSAASPGLPFAADSTLGLYRAGSGILGVSAAGLQSVLIRHRTLSPGYDNVRVTIGVPVAISTEGVDTFVATLDTPSVNMTGTGSRYVGWNIGTVLMTLTDALPNKAVTNIEVDKVVMAATAGPVTIDKYQATRFRFGVPQTDVTVTDMLGIDFVMPNTADVTGSVVNYKAINIPVMSASGGTNFYGMFFNNDPSGGGIASKGAVNLSIKAGYQLNMTAANAASLTGTGLTTITASNNGASNAQLVLNAIGGSGGTGGSIKLQDASQTILQLDSSSATNSFRMQASASIPLFRSFATSGTLGLNVSAHGGASFFVSTNSGSDSQVEVTHTASANRRLLLTGSNGGNPTITTTAGSIAIGRSIVVTNSITTIDPLGGIGYATGAGGTQTQNTSKSTTVALNKVTGQITTNNATLAAGTLVSFTFNNTSIASTDMLLCQHISGGTVGAYTVTCSPGSSTSTVTIRNVTAGDLSEAIVIQFSVIKAVTAENDNWELDRWNEPVAIRRAA